MARHLNESLKACVLSSIVIPPFKNLLKNKTQVEFEDWLHEYPFIMDVSHYSKYLFFITSAHVLVTHFKFTGWWYPGWEEAPQQEWLHPVDTKDYAKYARMAVGTDKGVLYYTDPRALGGIWLFTKEEFLKDSPHLNLGPQVTELGFSFELFKSRCRRNRKDKICDVLIDQRAFSGIGNYLRCEILNRALQDPFETAFTIPERQLASIYNAIRRVIGFAMVSPDYNWWFVFQRKETPAGHKVVREEHKGRGIYWCPETQKRWVD